MKINISFSSEARKKIVKGVNAIAKAVGATYGPNGNNVLISENNSTPYSTKDGVTVAQTVEVKNNEENVGVELIKESALKTLQNVGDGTTSTVLLAQSLINKFNKALESGANHNNLIKGLEYAQKSLLSELEKNRMTYNSQEDLKKVALISTNGDDEMSEIISKAIWETGNSGAVSVDLGSLNERNLRLDTVNGLKIDLGYSSPYWLKNGQHTVELINPYVLVTDQEIRNPYDIISLLNEVASEGRSILIIAADYSTVIKSLLIENHTKDTLPNCAIYAPGITDDRQELLEDIAVFTGGKFFTDTVGMKLKNQVHIERLGSVDRAVVYHDRTLLIGAHGNHDVINLRLRKIDFQLSQAKREEEIRKFQVRKAKLGGLMTTVVVGGKSEQEMKEKRDRVEDALAACREAQRSGVVPGGASALLKASMNLNETFEDRDIQIAYDFVKESTEELFDALFKNKKNSLIKEKVLSDKETVYDIRNKKFISYNEGVQEPFNVVQQVLLNATSAAKNFILIDASITLVN